MRVYDRERKRKKEFGYEPWHRRNGRKTMTEAAFWCGVCAPRMSPGSTLARDVWSRRTLAEAATGERMLGFCRMEWTFGDGSLLIAGDDGVRVSLTLKGGAR
jgi:hypothetical protein